ncbi:MAG: hypothetical protein ACLQL2_10040 [Methylovirgula sp.]
MAGLVPAIPAVQSHGWLGAVKKSDIINLLGAKYGFVSHLEISTPITGFQYALIDRTQYTRCERAVYGIVDENALSDQDITYGTSQRTSCDIVSALSTKPLFDVVFVDPHHTYENSFEDIVGGFSLLRQGGALVIHDCNPPNSGVAAPDFTPGDWCGVTYWAYIDFVLGRAGITYYTVDTDYGCGVVFKQPGPDRDTSGLQFDWVRMSRNDDSRYDYFDRNRQRLLNLISVDEFRIREGLPLLTPPSASA